MVYRISRPSYGLQAIFEISDLTGKAIIIIQTIIKLKFEDKLFPKTNNECRQTDNQLTLQDVIFLAPDCTLY